ncbi:MAG: iron-sulfur cluster assembly protein [Bacteroidales bacterium]
MKNKIIEILSTIYDPEIPVNIWELGFIYEINITENHHVEIVMTLTAPNCPVAESLPLEVKEKILAIEGVEDVAIRLTFDPPWTMDKMSEAARLELGLD